MDEGEEGNDAIILLHGFPDLWYGWRYQIPYLVSKGYRVITPDLRGYGQTVRFCVFSIKNALDFTLASYGKLY